MTSQKTLCGYRRLTVDRNGDKIGYEVQAEICERWAKAMGWTIGRWYEDRDLTAADRKVKRAGYEQMLVDIEAGMWGGVVVSRLDRLVRLTREFERCFGIIEDAGGVIVSAGDGFSTENDVGKFIMRIMVMLAEMEISGMRARIRANKQAKREKGEYLGGGHRPYGFVGPEHDEEGKVINTGKVGIEHVKDEADILRNAADRIAWAGESTLEVIQDWHSRTPPVYGATGAPWTTKTLEHILTAPRIAGKQEFTVVDEETGEERTEEAKAVWDEIIDEATWRRLRVLFRPGAKKGPKGKYLLSGLVSCGRCGRALTGCARLYEKSGVPSSTRTYRCKSSPADAVRGSCGKLGALAEPVERIVAARLLELIKRSPRAFEALSMGDDKERAAELASAMAAIADCDSRLADLAHLFGAGEISSIEWRAARQAVDDRRIAAAAAVESLTRHTSIPVPSGKDRQDLAVWFEDKLTLTQRRLLVKTLVESVSILPTGRSGPRFDASRVVVTVVKL